MKTIRKLSYGLTWVIIFILLIPPGIMAQDYGEADHSATFTKAELTQMLAPIALYPDSLIAQILMASTYPIEVVESERWLKTNANLTGTELDKALQEKAWDSSIKSLCHFPEVLYAMSEKLDQTTKLGDAFLIQQNEVMETIQDLRRRAREQETLKTTKEQKVIVEREIIRIEPANPQVIYVPIYNPLYVYGPWWYPAYPPYYCYYPPSRVYASRLVGFGVGFIIGIGISSWTWCDWHHHHLYVDIHKTKRFHKPHRYRKGGSHKHVWKHKPYHRRGVAYKHDSVRQRYVRSDQHVSGNKPKAYGSKFRDFGKQPKKTFRRPNEKQARVNTFNRKINQTRTHTVNNRGNTFNNGSTKRYERRKSEKVSIHPKTGQASGKTSIRNVTYTMKPRFIRQDTKSHKMVAQDTAPRRSGSKGYKSISRSNTSHTWGTIGKSPVGRTYSNARNGGKVSSPFRK